MTEIYLIRHAEAEGNLYRMMQGHWDGDVTSLGLEEIEALARRFKGIHLDSVYSSDLYRAMLTARGAARFSRAEVIPDRRLRELNVGPWEGKFFGNIVREYPEEIALFLHSPKDWKFPGAETVQDVVDRAYPALLDIAESNPGRSIAVVSHGVTIRCLLSKVNCPSLPEGSPAPIVKNTAVTKLVYENGNFTARYIGDASHIENLKVSDWIANEGLRDEVFSPENDGDYYLSCYEDAWRFAHGGSTCGFNGHVYLSSAEKHSRENSESVLRLYDGDTPAGLVDMDTFRGAHAGYGWISLLYIEPDYRFRGYGVQALGRAIKLYKSLGKRAVRLYAAEDNRAALSFYKKHGFEILSSEHGATGILYLMEKKLRGN